MRLQVLYRFLEFFSNFDWDNFCVSLWGPVPIGSLPDMTGKLLSQFYHLNRVVHSHILSLKIMQQNLPGRTVVTYCSISSSWMPVVLYMQFSQAVKKTRVSLLFRSILTLLILYGQTTTSDAVSVKVYC